MDSDAIEYTKSNLVHLCKEMVLRKTLGAPLSQCPYLRTLLDMLSFKDVKIAEDVIGTFAAFHIAENSK